METANFTSKIFKSANNPWGMKNPQTRRTTAAAGGFQAVPGGVIWARYYTLEDAAMDIILYMDNFKYPTASPTLKTFCEVMKSRGYFEESVDSYYQKVEAWKDK